MAAEALMLGPDFREPRWVRHGWIVFSHSSWLGV